ncbi:unnamed protein product [Triticum turgidum subsp. durum]|uniref:Uncharacterized protein n=1 Tax=Triticum turgidum subsp. durum TaxID=4567 RepID=A0A9R0RQD7_TRITD|nr:unnamed protein product [Triticum turgidum subsp. durum]
MSKRAGPPKHQNTYAWKPNLGRKINETEPGGRFRPLSEITGVCQRCRDQIDWKRKYGKYKPIVEPAKCQKCSKRNVRQAYHNVCTGEFRLLGGVSCYSGCSKELGICAKCCTSVKHLVGRDAEEANSERKELEEMNKNKDEESGTSVPKIADRDREGDLFPVASLDEYAEQAVQKDESDEEDARDFVKD